MGKNFQMMDGNTAAAHVAYALSEVAAIYPITPSSPMGELADAWAATGRKNVFGELVHVVEMQSEGGASGAVHGSLSAGALTTTFTASQGLMLMLPNMHKIAGELLPAVFHVSARSLACQSLSIFGDHSDVMAARNTGFALLSSNSVQEVMDLALVAHLSAIESSVPFLHFFDGFRTSHEIQKIEVIDYEDIEKLVNYDYIEEFRKRALNPEKPFLKVGAQNPDVYFQGRETVNKFYLELPAIVQKYMNKVGELTGRKYNLFDYVGAPDAQKVIIAMGSGCETIEETVNYLVKKGEKVGLVKVRLYRPFSIEHFVKALPETVKKIAVLDRTKEPGSTGEPLYLDVVDALKDKKGLLIIGGRYGLSSKEFTPSMVKAVYDHLDGKATHGFTVGINDDVTGTSIEIKEEINTIPEGTIGCKFWGFGSDGTVGASKNTIKIIGEGTDMYAQGYFEYDSKKSGGVTRSHLRFGKEKIQSTYLVRNADFIACHNPAYVGRYDVLEGIKENGVFLLNSNWKKEEVFENLTLDMQKTIIEKKIKVYNVDALSIANEVGLGKRINTVMQTAFFLVSGILPKDKAIEMIKAHIEKTYSKKGKEVVAMNLKAVDKAAEAIEEIPVPAQLPAKHKEMKKLVPDNADKFTKNVIEKIMMLKGDEIPVSDMPIDGAVPTGTTRLEKRGVAPFVPRWIPDKCIQCNQCSFVCPHAAIRPKLIEKEALKDAPETFKTLEAMGKDKEKYAYKIQVFVDDCQGCVSCVNICPKGALEMVPAEEERERGELENEKFFTSLPEDVLGSNKETTVKGSQFKQPLFEFSGACAGCGETPYVKLVTQLYGDRMIIANATGCSSIYGGTFPTVPYCKNKDGEGPAWANSLFEDNAEYGFGMRLAVEANREQLKNLVMSVKDKVSDELKSLFEKALQLWNETNEEAKENSRKIKSLLDAEIEKAEGSLKTSLKRIKALSSYFVDKSVWIIGGDGWAYDIGYGGLDHVLASNRNVNVLVLDTEVYSNTGGQSSKATPLGSMAKFASAGKTTPKKDLALMATTYGYVYVATISMGANKAHALQRIVEAESYDGPSIVIAYSPCINHGYNLADSQEHEKLAVETGYWPLFHYDPRLAREGKNPFVLDYTELKKDPKEFLETENRYRALKNIAPERAEEFYKGTVKFIEERHARYRRLAGLD